MADSYARQSITIELADKIIAGAVRKATADGGAFTVAVVDESGVLKAFTRMDGAPLVTVQIAQDKAYTAVGFGMPSHGWFDFIKDDEPLRLGAPTGIDRLVVFGGGYPVMVGGQLVGGVGVSGGHYTQDMAVAQAGLEAALGDPGAS